MNMMAGVTFRPLRAKQFVSPLLWLYSAASDLLRGSVSGVLQPPGDCGYFGCITSFSEGNIMCRWAAYIGDPIYLEEIISRPDHSLIAQSQKAEECKTSTNGDGFGVA